MLKGRICALRFCFEKGKKIYELYFFSYIPKNQAN